MRRFLLLIFAAAVLPLTLFAQTGLPPFGSIDQIGLEYRNNQDLNVLVSLPVVTSPGRGGLSLNFGLVYNSSIWANNGTGTFWSPNVNNAYFGWTTAYGTGFTTYKYSSSQFPCDRNEGDVTYTYTTTYTNYVYVDSVGTTHPLPLFWQRVENDCTNQITTTGTFSGYATDGSGYLSSITSTTPSTVKILTVGGMWLTPSSVTDTNGNYISSTVNGSTTTWTDSAGRVALEITTNTTSIAYQYPDPNNAGQFKTTTLNLQPLNVKTNFGCANITEFSESSVYLPSSLVLPNNQTYTFAYEQTPGNPGYTTGRLQRITMPNNGYYEYDYPGANDSVNCTDGTALSMNRVVNDGTSSKTWNYVRNTSSLTTTITTPQLADTTQANDMVITFNSSGQETARKIFANSPGSGTPLRTINTTWASNGTPATRTTILEDGSTQSKVATTYDSNGLLDSVSEYNLGVGAPGSLFRTTTYTYQTSTNYTNLNILNLVTSKQIKDGSGTMQYRQDTYYDGVALLSTNCPAGALQHGDSAYPCTFNYRGNPTNVTTYLSPATQGNGVIKNFTYDWFGNLRTAQVNCCQNKTWAYSATTQYSLPDSIQSGTSPSLTTSYQYNSYTGQATLITDPNGLNINISYDSLRRPTQITQSSGGTQVGGTVSYAYNDANFTSTTTATIDTSKSVQQITALDALGRPNLTTTEDAGNNVYSKVTVAYDHAGRAYQTSNPYTGTSPSYWTTTAFDALGRPTTVTVQDNSVTTITYATNTTTAKDPAGNQRESVVDASGRLSTIYEPNPPSTNNPTLPTSYTYSVLDELTQITQGSQTRTYVYDALGRLNSATTPEAGTVCFGTYSGSSCQSNGYDQFDNLLYRTDARGVVTNYIYDSLNRLLGVTYPTVPSGVSAMPNICKTTGSSSNNANVCLTYGTSAGSYSNGLPVTMTDGVGSENYTYNSLEQLTQLQKVIGTNTFTTGYAYNLAGELTKLTYPSGRVVQQSVDTIGRLCEVAPSTNGCGSATSPFATGLAYNAAGQLTDLKYGNGLYASFGFSNQRLQLNCIDYSTTSRSGNCTHDGTTKFGLSYSYPAAPSNNGLISGITDSVEPGRTASYTYDSLYRLVTAQTAGSSDYPAWGLSETYDRYGNRPQQTAIAGTCVLITCPQPSVAISTTTNRLVGSPYTYDASGNMTNDGINTLVYDAENHVTSSTSGSGSGTYTYDGKGQRVEKVGGGNTIVTIFLGNQVLAEYYNGSAPSAPTNEYIYAGNLRLAIVQSGATYYWHNDHLSPRVRTDSSGNIADQRGTFPFGETWYGPGSTAPWMFTNYYRDVETSGNDYAQARTYVSGLARFSSPDPIAGGTSDPQSLNRYSYVRNMPVMLSDPAGLFPGGCIPVAKHSDHDNQSSDSGRGKGPNDSSIGDWNPEPQGDCANGVDNGGGGGGTLDGIPFGDIPFGLMGNGESNNGSVVPLGDSLGFNSWVTDPLGNGWQNPTDGCVSGLGSGDIYCGGSEYAGGTEPDENSELDLYTTNNSTGPPRGALVFLAAVLKASANCAKILGGLPQALRLANGAQLAAIDAPGFAMPTDPDAVGVVQKLTPDAFGTVLAPAGVSFVGNPNWNGQSFTIYTNANYAGFNTAQQLTVLIHELHHVALGQTDASRALDWGDTGASPDMQNIAKQCHTAVPPGYGPQ